MATLSLTLPENLQGFVDRQVESGAWSDGTDYVRDLIRRDQERHALRELLLEGARSPVGAADDRYFDELHSRIRKA